MVLRNGWTNGVMFAPRGCRIRDGHCDIIFRIDSDSFAGVPLPMVGCSSLNGNQSLCDECAHNWDSDFNKEMCCEMALIFTIIAMPFVCFGAVNVKKIQNKHMKYITSSAARRAALQLGVVQMIDMQNINGVNCSSTIEVLDRKRQVVEYVNGEWVPQLLQETNYVVIPGLQ